MCKALEINIKAFRFYSKVNRKPVKKFKHNVLYNLERLF